jgi:hypothetical protein
MHSDQVSTLTYSFIITASNVNTEVADICQSSFFFFLMSEVEIIIIRGRINHLLPFYITPPQEDNVTYLGLHLDRRLTWHKPIFTKRKQLGITLTKMYWLLERKSKLSTSNKLLVYKTILKPIWTYGI